MALVPRNNLGRRINPYQVAAAGIAGFNILSQQVRQARRNVRDLVEEGRELAHTTRQAMTALTPRRLTYATPRTVRGPRTVRRTPRTRSTTRTTRGRTPTRRRPNRRTVRPGRSRRVPTGSSRSVVNRLLGPPPGTSLGSKKSYNATLDYVSRFDKVLYARALIDIPFNGEVTRRNTRHSGAVHVTGVRCIYRFRLNDTASGQPIRIRWAILINKEDLPGSDTNQGLPTDNWFEKKDVTFNSENCAAFNNNFSAADYETRRINRRDYHVLDEGKLNLQKNKTGTAYTGNGTKQTDLYGMVDRFVPLNSQVRFNLNQPADRWPVDKNVYFVWWAYSFAKTTIQIDPAAIIDECHERFCYFKEHDL